MSFADFIIDEEDGNKKRKEIEEVIKKAVAKNIIDVTETENCCVINFMTNEDVVIKDAKYQVIVTLDYYKKIYRGMHRAVYINIIKETNSYRDTDYIQVDIHDMNEAQYAQTLDSIKNHFASLVM
jgi:hypothetical protein